MDRDRRPFDSARRRDLPPDVPPEDRFGSGGGQSYRPSARRSPPRDYRDSYRARSPRARTPPPIRYRSRSPPRRSPVRFVSDSYPPRRDDYRREGIPRGADSYRTADRPRREDLPRTDLLRRDPIRDERDYRESYRDERDRGYAGSTARSPLPRHRDRSMSSRGRRTPPRASRYDPPSRGVSPPRRRYSPDSRDRRQSPPRSVARDFRVRSRSPLMRNPERADPRSLDEWRRRSPAREPRHDYLRDESGANSAATSRRSSPPVHPSRAAFQSTHEEPPRSGRTSPRDSYDTRDPYRAGDADQPTRLAPSERDSAHEERNHSNGQDVPPPREPKRDDAEPNTPRAPPTGPSSQRGSVAPMAPPTGPATASTPSGPRTAVAPPAGPRGTFPPRGDFAARGDFAGRGRGGFATEFAPRGRGTYGVAIRGGRGGAPTPGPGFGRSPEAPNQDSSFGSRPPPSGPRNSFSQATPPTFRQSPGGGAVAPSGPRAQRYPNGDVTMPDAPTGPKAGRRPTEPALNTPINRPHPALAELPKIVDGGMKAEPIIDRTKLSSLEDEADKLRRQIEEKELRKRKTLREWDRMARESEAAALRSELAEQALKELNGEAESQAAF